MVASFETRSLTPRTPEETFALIRDLSRWPLFRGWGPLPGIREATLPDGGQVTLGSRIRVTNTDGSVHHETVVALEPARLYTVRMELSRPASWIIGGIVETVSLAPVPEGTRLVRRFSVTARSVFTAPLAWLITRVFLRRAVLRHDAAVVAALAGAPRSIAAGR